MQQALTRSPQLIALVVAVDLLALFSIALLSPHTLVDQPLTVLTILALSAAVGSRSIPVPGTKFRFVAADAFVFFALLVLTPAVAPLAALASVIGLVLGKGLRLRKLKIAFNLGALPLSVAVGAHVFVFLRGAGADIPGLLPPLLAAATVYAVVNVLIAATAVHLATGAKWIDLCVQSFGLALVSNITNALVAVGLLAVYLSAGPAGLLVGLIPLIPMERYVRSLVPRVLKHRGDSISEAQPGDTPVATGTA